MIVVSLVSYFADNVLFCNENNIISDIQYLFM